MSRGSKDSYTDKQKRQAKHIEQSYEDRGESTKEAARHAWATVNKESGGGRKSGSGRTSPRLSVSAARRRTSKEVGTTAPTARRPTTTSSNSRTAATATGTSGGGATLSPPRAPTGHATDATASKGRAIATSAKKPRVRRPAGTAG
jgi:hypothetical protein